MLRAVTGAATEHLTFIYIHIYIYIERVMLGFALNHEPKRAEGWRRAPNASKYRFDTCPSEQSLFRVNSAR